MARSDDIYHYREDLEKGLYFAQSVRAGNTLYFSGLISIDMDGNILDAGDIGAQVRNIYADLQKLITFHGLTFENVVKETIYTTDISELVKMSGIRREFFGKYAPPAATWVEVKSLVFEGAMLEVDFTLHVPWA